MENDEIKVKQEKDGDFIAVCFDLEEVSLLLTASNHDYISKES